MTWEETAIGAVAMLSCPCGRLQIGLEMTRKCNVAMDNLTIILTGTWEEPDYSSCEFTDRVWQLCDAVQVCAC